MVEIKVGEFLRRHIDNIIELCKNDYQCFIDLQSTSYCSNTFGLLSRYSLLLEYDEIRDRGIFNRYYKNDYLVQGKTLRVCSQFGGNHLIHGMSASAYHGKQLLFFFQEKGILLDEFKNKELSFIVASSKESSQKKDNNSQNSQLNQILYGPPGTGKTYNTINRALEIMDGEVSQDRAKAKARFEELSSAGQIEFVTFHQSYGYEEFVEGIKANSVDGNISYNVEGGIFKKLSVKASSDDLDFSNTNEFDNLYSEYVRKFDFFNDEDAIGTVYKTKRGNEFKVFKNSNSLVVKANTTYISLSCDLLKRTIAEGKPPYYDSYVNIILPDILQGREIKIEKNTKVKNYILIIDEINRGNISKIFGELITLIEPSKRIGAEEEIQLCLPYSNDMFGVPLNLYIIGTMNTADRSIALMDTALRRRFEFVEMMPNAELLDFEVAGVNLKALLQKINARVEYLYDRDHTIGHAYFMELDEYSSLYDLNAVMKNKIIPLLQEYFYDDWEKIKLVLNDGFIEKDKSKATQIFDIDMDDEYIEDEKSVYSVAKDFTKESYRKIYDKI